MSANKERRAAMLTSDLKECLLHRAAEEGSLPGCKSPSGCSTVASEADCHSQTVSPEIPRKCYHKCYNPDISPELPRKLFYNTRDYCVDLPALEEHRGWKYFLRHQLSHAMAMTALLVVGVILGAGAVIIHGPVGNPRALESTSKQYPAVTPPISVPAGYMVAQPLNNSCLIPNIEFPAGPQNFNACEFVIKSTDEVWNRRGDVDAAIEKYFHKNYFNPVSWGKRGVGKKALRDAILTEMRAFPDIQIHITDCMCKGNDNDGYKCAMPDVLTGTNLGPSAYGPATGRFARWTGLVESLVQLDAETGRWQYIAEWGVHDEWSLIQQLGLDFAKVPHPNINSESLHDCKPLVHFSPEANMNMQDAETQNQLVKASQS